MINLSPHHIKNLSNEDFRTIISLSKTNKKMKDSALIFIPDISGYIEFTTQTEIRHSKHIIFELLEIIIDCNELVPFEDNIEAIDNFEKINLKLTKFSSLREKILKPVLSNKQKFHKEKPDAQIEIKAPLMLVYELLTDINAKMDYVPDIKKVSWQSRINRVNSSHTCVFDDLEIHFVTLSNENKEKELSYIEEANLSIGIEYISDYRMEESRPGTKFRSENFPQAPFD